MARKPTIKTCPYQNNPAEYPFGLIQVRRWSRFLASETAPIGSVRPHCRLEARVGPCPSNQSAAGKNRDLAKAAAAAVAVLAGVVQGGMDLHLGHSDGAWGAHRAPSARASGLLMHVPDNRGPTTAAPSPSARRAAGTTDGCRAQLQMSPVPGTYQSCVAGAEKLRTGRPRGTCARRRAAAAELKAELRSA